MSGFGRLHGDFDGFLVAHFSHQNYFRGLTQCGSQCMREGWSIAMQFALVNNAALMGMQKLDRVLDSKDVICLYLVDQIDNCRQRR